MTTNSTGLVRHVTALLRSRSRSRLVLVCILSFISLGWFIYIPTKIRQNNTPHQHGTHHRLNEFHVAVIHDDKDASNEKLENENVGQHEVVLLESDDVAGWRDPHVSAPDSAGQKQDQGAKQAEDDDPEDDVDVRSTAPPHPAIPGCVDNAGFKDAFGYTCEDWVGLPCNWFCESPFLVEFFSVEEFCFRPDEMFAVVTNCCFTCATHPDIPVTVETWPTFKTALVERRQQMLNEEKDKNTSMMECICTDRTTGRTIICEECTEYLAAASNN